MEFNNRIEIVEKEDEESADKLIQIIDERIENNFFIEIWERN